MAIKYLKDVSTLDDVSAVKAAGLNHMHFSLY